MICTVTISTHGIDETKVQAHLPTTQWKKLDCRRSQTLRQKTPRFFVNKGLGFLEKVSLGLSSVLFNGSAVRMLSLYFSMSIYYRFMLAYNQFKEKNLHGISLDVPTKRIQSRQRRKVCLRKVVKCATSLRILNKSISESSFNFLSMLTQFRASMINILNWEGLQSKNTQQSFMLTTNCSVEVSY